MNEDQSSQKRQTIRIKIPRKPAAPRHSLAIAKALPLPADSVREQTVAAIRTVFPLTVFPVAQMAIALVLAAMVLDEGECMHIVFYAITAYLGVLCLMTPRRQALTHMDAFLIRWGFVFLCVLSGFVASMVWTLRR